MATSIALSVINPPIVCPHYFLPGLYFTWTTATCIAVQGVGHKSTVYHLQKYVSCTVVPQRASVARHQRQRL